MFRTIVSDLNVSRSKRRRLYSPLYVEMLEERVVPTQWVWTNGTADGLWTTPANWTDPATNNVATSVPGSGDDVLFGNGARLDFGALTGAIDDC